MPEPPKRRRLTCMLQYLKRFYAHRSLHIIAELLAELLLLLPLPLPLMLQFHSDFSSLFHFFFSSTPRQKTMDLLLHSQTKKNQ